MPDNSPPAIPFERWVTLAGKVIAPTTAIGALLFYFGYVSARSQYAYFGLDVDTIGLSTQDFVMRSSQTLLVPLLVLTVFGAGAVLVQAAIRRGLTSAYVLPESGRAARARRFIGLATVVGLLVLAAGMVLLLLYSLLSDWTPFDLVTPLVIALGGTIAAYALSASRFAASLESASDLRQGSPVLLQPAVSVFILVLVAASIFWATATVAQWSGRGLAREQALHLDELPAVVLDTKERLFLTSPGLSEVVLPPSTGQTFHYRYRQLRLLIQGDDRMFLVPDRWSASNSTLLVRLDSGVRLQFRFVNQPP